MRNGKNAAHLGNGRDGAVHRLYHRRTHFIFSLPS